MKSKVLIVDDTPAAATLATMAEEAGFETGIASDPSTAIKRIETESFEAILLDPMVRGRMNGFSVLSFLELDRPDLVARTFLVTALCEQTVLHTAPELMPRLFRKPVDLDSLGEAIRKLAGPGAHANVKGGKRRALIAEDDAESASLLAGLMIELGYAPSLAMNGREAIQELAADDYAILILDLMMPDVDGFALLEYIEEMHPSLLARVIVSTGVPERFLGSLDAKPIRGVLHKPVRLEELNRLLETAGR